MKKIVLGALLSVSALAALPVSAQVITTNPNGGSIGNFGATSTPTYGQVFTAPITGLLTSFTLSLNGGVGQLFGGVGSWNGPATYADGFGSPANLFQSGNVASSGAQAYTFSPNVSVTAGQRYVAYLSTYGLSGAAGSATMPTATAGAFTNYFVFNNSGDPRGDSSWDYFGGFGPSVAFTATFAPAAAAAVPEPATWAMLILGMAAVGYAMRRSNMKFDAKIKRMTAAAA